MSIKTPGELASENYCHEHGLYFKRFCPACQLEEWDEWHEPKDEDVQQVTSNENLMYELWQPGTNSLETV